MASDGDGAEPDLEAWRDLYAELGVVWQDPRDTIAVSEAAKDHAASASSKTLLLEPLITLEPAEVPRTDLNPIRYGVGASA